MLIKAVDVPKDDILYTYSNPIKAQNNLKKYLGNDAVLYKSSRKDKKYMVYDPNNKKFIHFGGLSPPYEDFLKHKDFDRMTRYLRRAMKIKGNWKNNLYSSNNLSIIVLWT